MDLPGNDAFQQLQVLTLMTLVVFMAPAALPKLRRYVVPLRIAIGVLYFGGGALILLNWYFRG
jgi:hypothetical protein